MADSLLDGHKSPRRIWSASCSSYCSLGTKWKEARLAAGLPPKYIVIGEFLYILPADGLKEGTKYSLQVPSGTVVDSSNEVQQKDYSVAFFTADTKEPDNVDPTPPYVPDSSGGDSTPSVTVPVYGNGNTVPVKATVSGKTATLNINTAKLDTVIGNATIDLTGLNKGINTAVIKQSDWKAFSDASNSKLSDMTGLTVKLNTGSVSFDDKAMTAALGGDVTVSITEAERSALTAEQRDMAGDRPVIDVSVLHGKSPITNLKDGTITVSAPYTPAAGENIKFLVIWYLCEDGKLEAIPCSYTNGVLTFKLTHLSE